MLSRSDHDRLKDMCSAYVDGEISENEKAEIESHLKICAECREELAAIRATVQILHRVPMAAAPRSFAVPETRTVRRTPLFGFMRMATAIAAVTLVFVFSLDVFSQVAPYASLAPASAPANEVMKTQQQPEILKKERAGDGAGALSAIPGSSDTMTQSAPGSRNPSLEPFPTVPPPKGLPFSEDAQDRSMPPKPESTGASVPVAVDQPASREQSGLNYRAMEIGLVITIFLLFAGTLLTGRKTNRQ